MKKVISMIMALILVLALFTVPVDVRTVLIPSLLYSIVLKNQYRNDNMVILKNMGEAVYGRRADAGLERDLDLSERHPAWAAAKALPEESGYSEGEILECLK